MFDNDVARDIAAAAGSIGVDPAALLAVAEVESAGKVFATVRGKLEPLIRFEGHYFDRRLIGDKRTAARAAGLASPVAGRVRNPAGQPARWDLLKRAAAIDHVAAHESVSWGLGQVMGAHWAWLGFGRVDALVAEARTGATGQTRLMCRFIEKAGLVKALQRRDWHAFARGYNGPAYAAHGYHTKMAAAFARYATRPGSDAARPGRLLSRGVVGEDVRALQRSLAAAGIAVAADGHFGRLTDEAVRRFQAMSGLSQDGIVGPATRAALDART